LLVGLGAGGPAWFQLLLFSVLSAVTLLLFRRRVMAWMGAPERDVGGLVGDVGVLLEDLPPGTVGKAELRGTVWSVRHEGTQVLARGLRVRVARVDGLMLHVRPE
jgi:membrane protein implicated in regulation of membrane protease activity